MLRQNAQQQLLKLLVFILHIQSSCNAIPSVQKSSSLCSLHHNIDDNASNINSDKHENVPKQLVVRQILESSVENVVADQSDVNGRQNDAK